MADLEIPERAMDATGVRDARDRTMVHSLLEAASPIIVAAELRQLADELELMTDRYRDEDGRGIRAAALGFGIVRLRGRADELDPEGNTP